MMNNYKGLMDGWHGDEPEVEAINNERGEKMDDYMQDYVDPMGDYLPQDDDDRRQWEAQQDSMSNDHIDLLYQHISNLKKLYGGK